MSISPLSSPAFQAAQNAFRATEAALPKEIPVSKELGAQSPFANFGEALAAKSAELSSAVSQAPTVNAAPPSTYKGLILQMVENTQKAQSSAGQEVQKLVQGDGSLHTAMIAMEEASVSFQLLVEMRNKLIESVQEVMKMQV